MKTKNKKPATKVGIILLGGGSTWYQGNDAKDIAVKCAKMCKSDWKHLFKFKRKEEFKVNIYDVTTAVSGWWSDYGNVYCDETNKRMPHLETITVTV